jgi:putative hydrolase of the HAD superfamily
VTGSPQRAVLCDLGGVVVDAPFGAFDAIEQRAGAARGAVREINARQPNYNAWARIERGEITVEEFVALFTAEAAAAGHRLPARAVIDVVHSLTPHAEKANPAIVDALRQCKDAGLRLVLVTNNVQPLAQRPESGWLFDLFDVVIESCVVGRRKPELAFYELALERAAVSACEAVMLDDLGINLKPARELGLRTIKVADPAGTAAQLLDLVLPQRS